VGERKCQSDIVIHLSEQLGCYFLHSPGLPVKIKLGGQSERASVLAEFGEGKIAQLLLQAVEKPKERISPSNSVTYHVHPASGGEKREIRHGITSFTVL
jgi:hypothetical protein